MIRKLLFISLLFINIYSQSNLFMKNKLIQQINALKSEFEGDLALFFFDPLSKDEIKINESMSFHAASTMKLAVMLELYRQASQNLLNLNDSILIRNEFNSIVDKSKYSLTSADDSDVEIYKMIGKKMTLHELNYRMITMSSNLATNILIDLITPNKIMQTMKAIGANNIKVLRGVEDVKAFRAGLNNMTTARDLYKILEAINSNKVTNEYYSNEMIKILTEQKHNDIIPALLPKNVITAHKTGWISGVYHDAAICFLPDGRFYYLVLLTKNILYETKAKYALQKISLLVNEYFLNK